MRPIRGHGPRGSLGYATASILLHLTAYVIFTASVSTIGTPCGCIMASCLTDLLGRKRTMIALQIPAIVGWTMVGFAMSVEWIYVGRFLVGLSSGMIGSPSRVYTAEVSQPHLRGVLAAFASVGTSLGTSKNLTRVAIRLATKWWLRFMRSKLNNFSNFSPINQIVF